MTIHSKSMSKLCNSRRHGTSILPWDQYINMGPGYRHGTRILKQSQPTHIIHDHPSVCPSFSIKRLAFTNIELRNTLITSKMPLTIRCRFTAARRADRASNAQDMEKSAENMATHSIPVKDATCSVTK